MKRLSTIHCLAYDIWITFRSRQRLVHYISTLSNDQPLSSGVTHSIKVKVSSFLFDGPSSHDQQRKIHGREGEGFLR